MVKQCYATIRLNDQQWWLNNDGFWQASVQTWMIPTSTVQVCDLKRDSWNTTDRQYTTVSIDSENQRLKVDLTMSRSGDHHLQTGSSD